MKFWKKKDKSKTDTNNPFDEKGVDLMLASSTASVASESIYEDKNSSAPSSTIGNRDFEQNRNDLFGGYNDERSPNNTSKAHDNSAFAEEEDPEVRQIQQQIRNVKQDSLASTRNALQKINEAEASAVTTMNMLGTQSTQIANINRNMDISKAYTDRASAQAGELKKLNRSIFIPVVKNPFSRDSKQRKEIEKLHEEHMAERNQIRQFEYDSSARIAETQRLGSRQTEKEGFRKSRSRADRNKYQFEADEEDDAIEDEIDQNLDLLSDATSRLKIIATGMNDELTSQNKQLNKLNKKVDPINAKLRSTTHTLDSTR
ncbi:hypothetical protein BDF20DRAFT_838589 [Mycotypha africana]|uniref:uncharacterized protein n=1 Tax=Mycotypha africana TaxID=64632 RepID=UPI0023001AA1|nr:uncharacterized protein BDF20DRAFT_838589 [Mycotypha africana]KAI8970211.1 hypothetical protein BDF20DRAFT_838589 [Mycotypha africana]